MKTPILLSLALSLSACAPTAAQLKHRDEVREAERQRKVEALAREAKEREEAETRAAQIRMQVEASESPGVMRKSFDALHEAPTATEVRNGKTVYWYRDTDPPMYFEFKNDKLVGKYVDKETLNHREDRDERKGARQEQAAKDERLRRLMIFQGMQNQTKRTNCTSTRFGNQVQTTCD